MFPSEEHFLAEYLLMHDKKRIADHFSLVRHVEPTSKGDNATKDALLGGMGMMEVTDFMCEGYMIWEACPTKRLSRGKDMLPRPTLERWLYGLFLKICLPHPRQKYSDRPVYSPLNLTALIRLVFLLSNIGYPAHWLSGILSALCDGKIATTARPPTKVVTSPEDVNTSHPALEMTVAPWRTEFTTLVSIWSRLFPFGLISPPGDILSPSNIGEFTVSFPEFDQGQEGVPAFVLLFWDSGQGTVPPDGMLWEVLRDDEGVDRSTLSREIRNNYVHIFTTMSYVTATRTALFWCRIDVMDKMRAGWEVSIWRTDTWTRVTEGVKVTDGVTLKRLWNQ